MLFAAKSSSSIEDDLQIAQFCQGKSDREIAVYGLSVTNAHVKECAARWNKIMTLLGAIGVCVLTEVLLKIGETFNIIPVGHLSKLTGQ